MNKRVDSQGGKEKGSRSKTARPQDEGGRAAKGFDRVPGPGPKDTGKGAAGPEAKERLDRNH
jgi:hypothetical protein